jgi:hypothetical protein
LQILDLKQKLHQENFHALFQIHAFSKLCNK